MQREIIEEDERPLHSLCKLIEERLEVNSVDRPLLCKHRDDLAIQVDPCDDCNSFKSQFVLHNLKSLDFVELYLCKCWTHPLCPSPLPLTVI